MNNEIQVYNQPLTKQEVIAQKRLIQEVMKSVMIGPTEKNPAGVHYGIIPGCKLPSLYKAGSEAILATFRIAVNPLVDDLSTNDCYRYRVTCQGVLPNGEIVGAGVGECSTDEEKYRWRSAIVPAEYENTPEDRRRIKYSRPNQWNKDGITQQVRTNPADLANTVLKMAKKRAQIDLTLTATGASDCFSQDLEDLPEEVRNELVREENSTIGKPAVSQPQSKSQKQAELTDWQKALFPRIEAALTSLFDADQTAKDAKIVELTTWTKDKGQKDEKVIEGTPNYQGIKTEKNLEILCKKLEKLVAKPADDMPVLCAECQQPYIDGACRNNTCCECKDYE